MKLNNLIKFNVKLDESLLKDKTFYTTNFPKMFQICKTLGNARFIFIPDNNLYVIAHAENAIHINLLQNALKDGRFEIPDIEYMPINFELIDEWYSENLEGDDYTGAIMMKNITKNPKIDMPDSTNIINEYSDFYLCNGLCIKQLLNNLTKETPKVIY